jgi:uncharacterized protein involved in cysteine biosynthesis
MPNFESVLVFLLLSLGLRWFLFKYKLLDRIRESLKQKHQLFRELFNCPYCQTFESSVLVYFVLGMPFSPVTGILTGLFNAYVSVSIENIIESQIEELEGNFKTPKTLEIPDYKTPIEIFNLGSK